MRALVPFCPGTCVQPTTATSTAIMSVSSAHAAARGAASRRVKGTGGKSTGSSRRRVPRAVDASGIYRDNAVESIRLGGRRRPVLGVPFVELESDLRVASDRMLRTLETLASLENEKREMKPGSPQFVKLAKEIERLAAEVFAQTHTQKILGEKAEVAEKRGADLAPIDEITPARDLQVILNEWRDAERRLQIASQDTAEQATAAADIGRLRDEYHIAFIA